MSYRLRVYAPTPEVNTMYVYTADNELIAVGSAAGTGTPCIDITVDTDIWIQAYFNSGYSLRNWVVSGASYTLNGEYCQIAYSDSLTNVFARVEASGGSVTPDPGETAYYGYMSYDLNGGSGSYSYEQGTASSSGGYYAFTMPAAPTFEGYSFQYWEITVDGVAYTRAPGETITLPCWGTTAPGTPYTAVAIWKEAGSGGLVKIDGVYYQPMIWNGTQWIPYSPEIYTASGWKQTTE